MAIPNPQPKCLGCKNPVQNCISMAQRPRSPHNRVNSGIPAMMRPILIILLTPRGNLCDLVCSSNRIASYVYIYNNVCITLNILDYLSCYNLDL